MQLNPRQHLFVVLTELVDLVVCVGIAGCFACTTACEAPPSEPPRAATVHIPEAHSSAARPETAAADEAPRQDPRCAQSIQPFDATTKAVPLRDALRHQRWVAVAELALVEPDCSGVGHTHWVLVDLAGETTAYRSTDVHGIQPAHTRYYLLGGQAHEPQSVDLNSVCVPYQGTANARPDWALPLDGVEEAKRWQQRLKQRTPCPN